MSTAEEEDRALRQAGRLLTGIGNGLYKVTSIRQLRADARAVLRHYPLLVEERWIERNGQGDP